MPDACLVLKEGLIGGGGGWRNPPSLPSLPGTQGSGFISWGGYNGGSGEATVTEVLDRNPESLWRVREVEGTARLAGRGSSLPCLLIQHAYQLPIRTPNSHPDGPLLF